MSEPFNDSMRAEPRRLSTLPSSTHVALLGFLACVAAALPGGAELRAQIPSATIAPGSQPMKTFALLFRQGTRKLIEAELKRRTEETRTWARTQNAAGHKLEPHILVPESRWIGPDGATAPATAGEAGAVTAILFLEARDFDQALEIARAHPATRYGSNIEVRSSAPPPPALRP